MTAPGSIVPPQPGWWVRNDYIGTAASGFGWVSDSAGAVIYRGHGSGGYGWSTVDTTGLSHIAFDAVGASAGPVSASSLSWSHTAALGTAVLAAVVCDGNGTTATATYNGTSLPLLANVTIYGSFGQMMVFGKTGVGTGSAAPIAVTLSATNNTCGNSVSYRSANSLGTVTTGAGGDATPMSFSANSAAQKLVFQVFGSVMYNGSASVGSYNQTSRFNLGASSNVTILIGDAPGASTVNFTATSSSAYIRWAACAVPMSY